MIRMHEIGVQAVGAGIDAVEQRMRRVDLQRVPAHVRDLERGIARRDGAHLAADPAQAVGDLELQATLGHELHADADAEERAALAAHGFLERLAHAGHGLEAALAIGEGADARQHDAVGGAHVGGIGADGMDALALTLARGALEGFAGRVEIAGPVIDDDDALHQSLAYVLGAKRWRRR